MKMIRNQLINSLPAILPIIFITLSQLSAPAAEAAWPFVYGPEVIVKTEAGQQEFTDAFTTNLVDGATYSLVVRNGNLDDGDNVTSAEIFLNGSEVVTEADFNQMVDRFHVDVELEEVNEMVINVKGAPQSTMTVAIVGRDVAQGFLWGGVLSSSSFFVKGGAFESMDALLHLKAIGAQTPLVAAIAFYGPDGKLIFLSEPFGFRNHSSRLFDFENLLIHHAQDRDITPEEILNEWIGGSIEIYWLSRRPSRAVSSVTWVDTREGRPRLGHLPVEFIHAGWLRCDSCQTDSPQPDAASSDVPGFTADQLAEAGEKLMQKAARERD